MNLFLSIRLNNKGYNISSYFINTKIICKQFSALSVRKQFTRLIKIDAGIIDGEQ